jgi:putative SOS response-associated peptidase YedK
MLFAAACAGVTHGSKRDQRLQTEHGRHFSAACTSWTALPNAVTAAVHDRMPAILDPDSYELWLDPGMRDVAAASDLMKPYDARLMRCYPVSTRVNHVANDDEECSAPVGRAQIQNDFFS